MLAPEEEGIARHVRFERTKDSMPHLGISSAYDFSAAADSTAFMQARGLAVEHIRMFGAKLNAALNLYWPCTLCYGASALACPITLGTSVLCMRFTMIAEAEREARRVVEQSNAMPVFANAHSSWDLKRESCFASSVVLTFAPLR